MQCYKADLHIHTVLSPCGDLEMSPANIVSKAVEAQLDIIGITDHNSTLHAPLVRDLALRQGIMTLMGAEVTSREEVHCLCFFEFDSELNEFQRWIDALLPKIPLDEERFGYQVVVNEQEEITAQLPYLLTSAIDADIDAVYDKVHSLNGLFIPAHVNREANSLTSQLGFVPVDLRADGLEISRHVKKHEFIKKNAYLKRFGFIQSSDAHYIDSIGQTYCHAVMDHKDFSEFRLALQAKEGRYIENIK